MTNATHDGLFVGVCKDQVRAFATEFERHALHRFGGCLGDRTASAGRTREADHFHVFVCGQLGANTHAVAIHKVEHASGDACIVDEFRKEHRRQWRLLRVIQDDSAASEQRGDDLERDLIHRPVPRCDQTDDANRF